MATLVVMYTKPQDVEGFLEHYENQHKPIAARVPDAQWTFTRFTATPRGGEPAYLLKAEAVFPSQDAMQAALTSPAMGEAAKDAQEMVGRFGNEAVMLLGEQG